MKKIAQVVCSMAVMAAVASCGNKNYYTINGQVDASVPEGTMVYMYNVSDPEGTLDSAAVGAEGRFVFRLPVLRGGCPGGVRRGDGT